MNLLLIFDYNSASTENQPAQVLPGVTHGCRATGGIALRKYVVFDEISTFLSFVELLRSMLTTKVIYCTKAFRLVVRFEYTHG